jgi:hypothetical protein
MMTPPRFGRMLCVAEGKVLMLKDAAVPGAWLAFGS